MEFVDTHCHIHFDNYALDSSEVLASAKRAGVTKLLAVGCTLEDSRKGAMFASEHDGVWAAVGFHPHEARQYDGDNEAFSTLHSLAADDSVVAVGECGLDYYYEHSPKAAQLSVLEAQLQIAQDSALPVIFHVRDAFDDFFPVLNNFSDVKGVVHSFTAGSKVLKKVIDRGLYVGLNGIMTFTKDAAQLEMARQAPLSSLMLETDAPFLTPVPFRGNICEPSHVVETAKFLAVLRGEPLEDIARVTSANACSLFGIS